MSEIINWVLNAKVKDVPKGLLLLIKEYGKYRLSIEFDDDAPEIEVREGYGLSSVRISNPDPEAKILDIVEDAIKLIEKYKPKAKKKKEDS